MKISKREKEVGQKENEEEHMEEDEGRRRGSRVMGTVGQRGRG